MVQKNLGTLRTSQEYIKYEGGIPRVSLDIIPGIVAGLKGRVAEIEQVSKEKEFILQALNTGIIGQEDACIQIADRLDAGLNRLMYRKGPLGVVFLTGPTGVGKTESIRVLAKALLGNENAYTRINCEQFQQQHTMRDLFGAPKSYVGYGSPTPLAYEKLFLPFEQAKKTKKIASIIQGKRDFGILLFDEIEKAHPNIRQSLLAILDDGNITFPDGSTTNFENVFIAMTSNIGESELSLQRGKGVLGFAREHMRQDDENDIFMQEIRNEFSPEFLGRVGEPIRFKSIEKHDCIEIVKRAIEEQNISLQAYFMSWNIHIGISPQAIDALVDKGYDPKQGARKLRRTIESYIFSPAHRILRKYGNEKFLSRKNPTILYFDTAENGDFSAEFFTPTIIAEPRIGVQDISFFCETTIDRVDELLSLPKKIHTLTTQLKEDGFSDEEIDILMYIDREYTLSTIFEIENFGGGINMYTDAEVFGDIYPPRWIKSLIQKKANLIIREGGFSQHVYLLTVIVKSILTIEKLLDTIQLTKEQENIVIRFAVSSGLKAWGVI